MQHTLSDHARQTALRAARVMFPHDALPDEAYQKVIRQIEAGANGGVLASFEEGLAGLDESRPFLELDEDAQLEALKRAEGSPFFELLRSTAVVELYDNPLVWKAFGYEGPSTHLGGYLHRGFDDLDWLPDPPLVMDPRAGSHHG